jgi:hypothetical protein
MGLIVGDLISDPHSFWLEARHQRVCAACGSADEFHAHHVVSQQILRRLRLPQYDIRNALRLCVACHMAFEWAGPGKVTVPITRWVDQNVCYTFEVLGVTAVQIEDKYGKLGVDERWRRHFDRTCPLCQLSQSE